MSASREKKKRQELLAGGGDPKAARAAEQKAAERKSNILYATAAIAFVVVAVLLVVYNSGIIQSNQTAVTLDGQNYNVAKTSYYYGQVYNNYAQLYSSYGLSMDLSDQADSLKEEAVNNMKFIHAAVTAAKADGLSLDDADRDIVKMNVDSVKEAAKSAGYGYGAYLKAMYGPYVSASVFESCLADQLLASKYVNKYSEDNFVYSEDEVKAYYEENKNSYDFVDGGYVIVSGTPEAKTDADGNAIEATEEEKAAALAAAEETANAILRSVQSGTSLEDAAAKYDNASYTGGEEMTTSTGMAGEWLFDESRRDGDTEILDDSDNSRYYVVQFNSRKANDYLDYNVRHVLVTAANLDLPDGETATEEQLTAKAEEILATWDGTEDGFAKLAEEYSQDGGSNTNGGLYEDVTKGYMIAPFENWCYESGRKSGDTGVIYYAGTGAHIMYFVGYGDTPYWYSKCEDDMRSGDQSEWQTELTGAVTAEVNEAGMKNVG